MNNFKKKILIGSPIRQKKDILSEFLLSLKELDKSNLIVDYYFIDDNDNLESKKLLQDFKQNHSNVLLITPESDESEYNCNEFTHQWNNSLIEKIANFKNSIIEYSIKEDYDYLFLIDSDIILHPKTLLQLISNEKEIVSNIFWTKWTPNGPPLPQVWLKDDYKLYYLEGGTDEEIKEQTIHFLKLLNSPGIYTVGGLGACTLISRSALLKGVNFSPLYNISFWGEDRHFCIRAVALGIELFVDTHHPAFHIYRPSDLLKVSEYKSSFVRNVSQNPTLTLSMVVKNEEHRYLRDILESCRDVIDHAVIIDDCSTDNTVALCEELLKNVPHKIIRNDFSNFSNEVILRKQQWEETISTNPDWILFLDADEVFEDRFKDEVKDLIKDSECDGYLFRLYDFWDDNHYREDELWCAHKSYRPFMIRYQQNFNYKFNEIPHHCGRMPVNVLTLPYKYCDIRLKHYGWANENDRLYKFNRYMNFDPNGQYGSMKQYLSILDPSPNLIRWIE